MYLACFEGDRRELEASCDAGARIQAIAQGIADEVEAVCGREPAAEILNEVKDPSEAGFDARAGIEVVPQRVADEVEREHRQHHRYRGEQDQMRRIE
jgi:hypothetical protein